MAHVSSYSDEMHVAASPSAEIRTEVIRELAALETMIPQWRQLQQSCAGNGCLPDPSQVIAMMRAMENSTAPYAIVRSEDGNVTSLVVGRTERRRIKCRVGYLYLPTPRLACMNVTYGGFLVPDDPEEQREAIGHIRKILDDGCVDHVMVNKFAVDHPLFRQLCEMNGAVVRERRLHWCADLVPGSYKETAERFERKDRYSRRKVRTIEKKLGTLELLVATTEEQLDEFIAGAAEVASRSFQAAIGAGFEDTPLWTAMLLASARAGNLRCYLLRCGGKPVAYEVGRISSTTYVLDAAAYDPQHRELSPGTVLLVLVIHDLCDNGFECLDYGFGDAPYKRQYGTRSWEECNIHLYGRRPRSQLTRGIDQVSVTSARAAKRMAGSGIAQRVRKAWRRKLERTS